VNAEKNDGYTTPGCRRSTPTSGRSSKRIRRWSCRGCARTTRQDDDLKNATHAIAIVFTQVGDNEATVTTDVERLVRAARDLFWRSVLDAQEGLAPILVVSEDYSALAPGNGYPFMKGGRLIVAATTLT
jgi:hypothetical protein